VDEIVAIVGGARTGKIGDGRSLSDGRGSCPHPHWEIGKAAGLIHSAERVIIFDKQNSEFALV
jgi:hypothetical protein